MFNNFMEDLKSDAAIEVKIRELKKQLISTDDPEKEYELLERIERFESTRRVLNAPKREHQGVSADTLVTSAAGLIGIFAILQFERTDIVTSKGLSIATKWLGH